MVPYDTGYIPYLVVSGLALDAMVIAGVLGAMATAREFERRTVKLLRLSPASAGVLLAGKLAVAAAVAGAALLVTLLVIVVIYGVVPIAPWTTVGALTACVVIFTCLGAWLGAVVERTLVAVPLIFGLVMPLYVNTGALEPIRFDGETIWWTAHLSPVYYAVGVLEWAFHGLRVTPEPVFLDMAVLLVIALASVMLTLGRLSQGRRPLMRAVWSMARNDLAVMAALAGGGGGRAPPRARHGRAHRGAHELGGPAAGRARRPGRRTGLVVRMARIIRGRRGRVPSCSK